MSAAGIYVEINGKPTDLDEASWYLVAPCGCTSGATIAYSDYGPRPALVVATADAALDKFVDSKAERAKYERLGFAVELGLRSDVIERMTDCTHTPKWGYSIPKPDGMVWAVGGYHGSRTKVLHLVPEEVATDKDGVGGYANGVTLCGQTKRHWTREWYITDGKVECSRCIKVAS